MWNRAVITSILFLRAARSCVQEYDRCHMCELNMLSTQKKKAQNKLFSFSLYAWRVARSVHIHVGHLEAPFISHPLRHAMIEWNVCRLSCVANKGLCFWNDICEVNILNIVFAFQLLFVYSAVFHFPAAIRHVCFCFFLPFSCPKPVVVEVIKCFWKC